MYQCVIGESHAAISTLCIATSAACILNATLRQRMIAPDLVCSPTVPVCNVARSIQVLKASPELATAGKNVGSGRSVGKHGMRGSMKAS